MKRADVHMCLDTCLHISQDGILISAPVKCAFKLSEHHIHLGGRCPPAAQSLFFPETCLHQSSQLQCHQWWNTWENPQGPQSITRRPCTKSLAPKIATSLKPRLLCQLNPSGNRAQGFDKLGAYNLDFWRQYNPQANNLITTYCGWIYGQATDSAQWQTKFPANEKTCTLDVVPHVYHPSANACPNRNVNCTWANMENRAFNASLQTLHQECYHLICCMYAPITSIEKDLESPNAPKCKYNHFCPTLQAHWLTLEEIPSCADNQNLHQNNQLKAQKPFSINQQLHASHWFHEQPAAGDHSRSAHTSTWESATSPWSDFLSWCNKHVVVNANMAPSDVC